MAKEDHTTIWVPTELRDRLRERKRHENQPYHEVIQELLDETDKERYSVRADVGGG